MGSRAILAILLLVAGARGLPLASAKAQVPLTWTQAPPGLWSTRGYFAVTATDTDGLILTSGMHGSTVMQDTYRARSNGTDWDVVSKSNGVARWSHAMSPGPADARSNASQGSIVVTGGATASNTLLSTSMISLNGGVSWRTSQPSSVGPSARRDHSQVHLPAGSPDGGSLGAAVVCGGINAAGSTFSDCWRLSSTDVDSDWELLTELGFPARCRAAMVRVPLSAASRTGPQLVVMGGSHGGAQPAGPVVNDVWASADGGKSWSRVIEAAPWSARAYHAAVAHPETGDIFLMGGQLRRDPTPIAVNDMWASGDAGLTWSLVTSAAPWLPRQSFGLTIDRNGCMVLAGGQSYPSSTNFQFLNDVWVTPAEACFRS